VFFWIHHATLLFCLFTCFSYLLSSHMEIFALNGLDISTIFRVGSDFFFLNICLGCQFVMHYFLFLIGH
jgi:hypothetical protein